MSNKIDINLIGGGFQHSLSTSGSEPLYIRWVKDMSAPVSMYVDHALMSGTNAKTKNYGWLVESKTINPSLYEWCEKNIKHLENSFDAVFTHDVYLAENFNIFVLCQSSGKSFISTGKIYEKNKLVSIIASNKVKCDEHKFRQDVIAQVRGKCDHFGFGYRPIDNKADGLRDYCFSIAMENGTYPNMFSEKITDCFMTGTIPIYYGISNIGDFFNTDGIITLDNKFRIDDLTFDLYQSKIDAVRENFRLAEELLTAEDYIYKNSLVDEI